MPVNTQLIYYNTPGSGPVGSLTVQVDIHAPQASVTGDSVSIAGGRYNGYGMTNGNGANLAANTPFTMTYDVYYAEKII